MKLKILSIFLIILLVLNLTMFILRKIDPTSFWITIVLIALIAYKGIPYLKKVT
jgi:hypothetical protein